MKPTDKNETVVPQHLDGDQLIAYLDGELNHVELSEARTHLESCWSCRGRLTKVQGSIEQFLRLRREKLTPPVIPPAGPAVEQFRRRMVAQASAPAFSHTTLRRFLNQWLHRGRERVAMWPAPSLAAKIAGLAAVASLAGYFIFVSNKVTTVTASELLHRAQDAHVRQTNATLQPVIHHRLLLKRKTTTNTEVSVGVEIWRDAVSSQFRRAIISHDFSPSQTANTVKADSAEVSARAVVDFERLCQANRVDWRQPLSARSFENWSRTVEPKREEVTRFMQNGTEVLSLKVVLLVSISAGQISEAEFVVRADDWHPVAERWRVKTLTDFEEFHLNETSFEVVSRSLVNPFVFAEIEDKAALSAATRSEASAADSVDPSSRPIVAASADLEIEVLALLNRAGANLGEQVSVTRTSDERLYVHGVVDTAQRKTEILSALRPVIANSAVVMNIRTADESKEALPGSKTVIIQGGAIIESASIPAYAELRAHFLSRGVSAEAVDERIRIFSQQILNRSRQALRHAWALRNLSSRLSEINVERLSPEARNKWLNMVQEHAAAVERETKALRRELSTVFRDVAGAGSSELGSLETEGELTRAVNRLVGACASNDGTIRVAFTVSSVSAASGLDSAQFWQSLRLAEETASRVQLAANKLKTDF